MIKIIDYKENMKIKKNCIVRGMPNEVYHKMPALSNSGLKTLLDCPAKYYYKYLSGEYEFKEKPYFKIGKAVHCYLLEGREAFERIYWLNPYKDLIKEEKLKILDARGLKIDKKTLTSELDKILLDLDKIERKQIELNNSEMNQIVCMVRAAKNDLKTNAALSQLGEPELSVFWYDEEFDIWFKCRPDFLPYNPINIPDYKTAESVRPEIFYKKFIEFGYFIQGAMYKRGIKAVLDIDVQNFYFIAQEKEPPYVTQIFNPADAFFLWGDKAISNAVSVYKKCKETGIWGGYTDKIVELTTDPMPDYLENHYDSANGIVYAPLWIDKMFEKYDV